MREHRALDAILEPGGITSLYQPIMDIGAGVTVAGFECLSRGPRNTNFESAKVLFEYVRLKREETLVDRACIASALTDAPKNEGLRLAINVHASTLARDHDFTTFLSDAASVNGIDPRQITVEIVEHAPPWDSIGFTAALNRLREAGMSIALDDVGLGQSNFKMMLDVCPNYMKLDQYFVESCESDENRRAVIGSVAGLAAHFGAEVIAEGVEREEATRVLRRYGIRLMQGFLYSKPLTARDAAAFVVRHRDRGKTGEGTPSSAQRTQPFAEKSSGF
jgi:EAL domain-containing protein (putative c-di-GMP-specific phosphodiesterase class I)